MTFFPAVYVCCCPIDAGAVSIHTHVSSVRPVGIRRPITLSCSSRQPSPPVWMHTTSCASCVSGLPSDSTRSCELSFSVFLVQLGSTIRFFFFVGAACRPSQPEEICTSSHAKVPAPACPTFSLSSWPSSAPSRSVRRWWLGLLPRRCSLGATTSREPEVCRKVRRTVQVMEKLYFSFFFSCNLWEREWGGGEGGEEGKKMVALQRGRRGLDSPIHTFPVRGDGKSVRELTLLLPIFYRQQPRKVCSTSRCKSRTRAGTTTTRPSCSKRRRASSARGSRRGTRRACCTGTRATTSRTQRLRWKICTSQVPASSDKFGAFFWVLVAGGGGVWTYLHELMLTVERQFGGADVFPVRFGLVWDLQSHAGHACAHGRLGLLAAGDICTLKIFHVRCFGVNDSCAQNTYDPNWREFIG